MKTTIQKAYKFRLYPNKEQREILSKFFGQSRFVYNYFLKRRIDYYIEHKDDPDKKGLTYFDTTKILTELKKQDGYLWLQESNAQVLQQSLRRLDVAYNNFFNKRAKFPNFKKKVAKQSITIPQNFSIANSKLNIPKLNNIKVTLHRDITGKQKHIVITKESSGKYYVSVICEVVIDIPVKVIEKEIGIDLGLKTFIVTSDGDKINKPKFLHQSENKLKHNQKLLSNKKKGSNNRNKQRIKVARLHEKITNQRNDFLHKISKQLVDENQAIYAEDLNVKGMLANHKLSKSISDCGWYTLIKYLEYKSNWYGNIFKQIDRFFPSSKRCNNCGWINSSLKLSDREWICKNCNTLIDRDTNAAKNVLLFGIGNSRVGATQSYKPVETTVSKDVSMKQEISS
jgi:putative transposase